MFYFNPKKFIFCVVCSSLTISANEKNLNNNICFNNKNLFPAQSINKNLDAINVVADESNITNKQIFNLYGDVEITSPDYYLSADKAKYLKSERKIYAYNNVKFQDESLFLTGSNIQLTKKEDDITQLIAIDAEYQIPESKIRGNAKKIIGDRNIKNLQNAIYTKCPVNNNSWFIRSSSVDLNSVSNQGEADNVTLYIFNTPVIYTPHHSWVLDGRGSGFLPPEISLYSDDSSTEKKDLSLNIPYYLNLQKDKDLLLSLNYLSSRGPVLKAKYRELLYDNVKSHAGDFEMEPSFLIKDKVTNESRWGFKSNLKYSFDKNQNSTTLIKIDRVSDQDYLKEISFGDTNLDSLNSSISYAYDDWNGLMYSFYAENEQIVNNGSTSYTRAPELYYFKNNSLEEYSKNLFLNYDMLLTNFKNKDNLKTDGARFHFSSKISKEHSNSSFSIVPSLQLLKTFYSLEDGSNFSRNLYKFDFDSQINLQRNFEFLNTNLLQILTPKIGYSYVPKKTQDHINSFDSVALNSSYDNLLSGNIFSGIDRIQNENTITLSIETEFINEDNGENISTLGIAQNFYLDNEILNSEGTFSAIRDYSNILTFADYRFGSFDLRNELEFDTDINKIVKSMSSISYQKDLNNFITLSYYDDTSESVSINAVQPITENSHAYLGITRSLSDSINNKITSGFAYESCCWAARLAFFNTYSDADNNDKSINFEFVLKGLTSTSPSLKNRLEDDIPNYLANLDD